ncbi:MAG: hypothetical protein Q4C95_11945 [Planctomycetia bacterium]|nr:hypothetical protein [Planctomycetia bacterium]
MSLTQNVLQWKFTACQYNIENANGFKTFSMSEGLSQDDKEELIQFAGTYTRPENLPDRPSPNEIELFPVVFLSFRLRSAKRVIAQISYVGKDYAGVRWGNFFSHALILPKGDWPFYPIQLWNSPIFQKGLTLKEQQLKKTPPPLPPLTIEPSYLRDFTDEFDPFFKSNSNRPNETRTLLAAIRSARKLGKTTLLMDNAENFPLWTAIVQYAFPIGLAQEIDFAINYQTLAQARKFHLASLSDMAKDALKGSSTSASMHFVFDMNSGKSPKIQSSGQWFDLLSFDSLPYPGTKLKQYNERIPKWTCSLFDHSLELTIDLINFIHTGSVSGQTATNVSDPYNFSEVTNEQDPSLIKTLDFFRKQPLRNRLGGIYNLMDNTKKAVNGSVLDALLPLMAETVLEADNKKLSHRFNDYFMRQFQQSLDELNEITWDERFQTLNRFFAKSRSFRRFGEEILEILDVQGNESENYLLLKISLTVILFPDFSQKMKEINRNILTHLSPEKSDKILFLLLPLIVDKCDSGEKHKCIIELFNHRDANLNDFYNNYIDTLKIPIADKTNIEAYVGYRYKTNQWKNGQSASLQATAFIDYLIHKAKKSDYDQFCEGEGLWKLMGIKDFSGKTLKQFCKTIYRRLSYDLATLNNKPLEIEAKEKLKKILNIENNTQRLWKNWLKKLLNIENNTLILISFAAATIFVFIAILLCVFL